MTDSPKSSDPKVSEEWIKERPKIGEYDKALELWRDQKFSWFKGNNMEDFEMIMVSSSTIIEIGYREDIQILRVHFLNGSIYEYNNFPLVEFEQFRNAPSVGTYLNQNIKGKYPYSKVGWEDE